MPRVKYDIGHPRRSHQVPVLFGDRLDSLRSLEGGAMQGISATRE